MDTAQARSLLGVAPGAPPTDVERAFRRAARRCHPDTGGSAAAFRRAVEARAVLLRAPGEDPIERFVHVTVTVIRAHPVVRLLEGVGRFLGSRLDPPPAPRRPSR
ncbi:MAG: hypothetical protein HYX34_07015 [Actinobacteria bacterium]|nr:hypothetical protein [Actinomycetota bacterium]